jgi:hypothetical protein
LKRERATALLEELLQRATGDDWPVELVEAVYVFGSYSRGAPEPGDLDVAVDLKRDGRWTSQFIQSMAYGRDPYSGLRQALRGRSRSVSILFERDSGHDDVPMTLLWERGEPLDTAIERVHAINVDPAAGRAPRDAMLACFDGLDDWLPRFVREELKALIDEGVIVVEQVILPDGEVADPMVDGIVDERWKSDSPLHRAALAALAYLESAGIDLRTVHLHGRDIDGPITPYFVSFELRHLSAMLSCFEDHGGMQWLEVVHPTRRGPLRALRIDLRDRKKLSARKNRLSFFA